MIPRFGRAKPDIGPSTSHLPVAKARLGRADCWAVLVMAAVVLWFAYPYLNPAVRGIPVGIDLGDDLAYLGTLRSELLEEGRLLTWWSVAYDGIPLLGHPLTQVFYPPLILPTLGLGTAGGVRVAYVASLLLAAVGMYARRGCWVRARRWRPGRGCAMP